MTIAPEAFRKNFPPGNPVPEPLLRLLEFQNQIQDWYSGYFELGLFGNEGLLAWFGGDAHAAAQFIHFGSNADGSLYCFWLCNGRSIGTAPIVFLGSEGQDNAVLAAGIGEFFALLAEGFDELGFPSGRLERVATEANLKFRRWLEEEFGILSARAPEKLIAAAQSVYPDLEKWIEDWQKKHGL